jgi:hypothetical protein
MTENPHVNVDYRTQVHEGGWHTAALPIPLTTQATTILMRPIDRLEWIHDAARVVRACLPQAADVLTRYRVSQAWASSFFTAHALLAAVLSSTIVKNTGSVRRILLVGQDNDKMFRSFLEAPATAGDAIGALLGVSDPIHLTIHVGDPPWPTESQVLLDMDAVAKAQSCSIVNDPIHQVVRDSAWDAIVALPSINVPGDTLPGTTALGAALGRGIKIITLARTAPEAVLQHEKLRIEGIAATAPLPILPVHRTGVNLIPTALLYTVALQAVTRHESEPSRRRFSDLVDRIAPVSRLSDELMSVGLPIPGTSQVLMLDGTQLDMSTGRLLRPDDPEDRPQPGATQLITGALRPPVHASPMERWYWSHDVLRSYESECEDEVPEGMRHVAS